MAFHLLTASHRELFALKNSRELLSTRVSISREKGRRKTSKVSLTSVNYPTSHSSVYIMVSLKYIFRARRLLFANFHLPAFSTRDEMLCKYYIDRKTHKMNCGYIIWCSPRFFHVNTCCCCWYLISSTGSNFQLFVVQLFSDFQRVVDLFGDM